MKVYITKYALTKGIIEAEGDVRAPTANGSMVWLSDGTFYHNDNWYPTYKEAARKAEAMRQAKIEALAKQLGRLKRKSFLKLQHPANDMEPL